MKNRKINLDRPTIDSKEIQAGMNFGQLMVGYQAMSKPFYKTNWFFGTTGLASIGLIVGGTFAFQSPDENEKMEQVQLITDAPPPEIVTQDKEEELFVLNAETFETFDDKKEEVVINKNKSKHEKIVTPLVEKNDEIIPEIPVTDEVKKTVVVEQPQNKNEFNVIDLTPRINGKMNGTITREDLLDNKGITTGSDVSIIHFELHLIDGLGGKVFEEESNQLNQDMKTALHRIGKGETIYFENIKGKTSDGRVVRLNPLRYVLLN